MKGTGDDPDQGPRVGRHPVRDAGLVIGSQGSSAGPLAIHLVDIADARVYWSWPVFFSGSGLAFGLMLLQR